MVGGGSPLTWTLGRNLLGGRGSFLVTSLVGDNRREGYVVRYVLSSNRGSPDRLRSVGIDGPKISVSRIPVRMPRRAKERARLTIGLERVDFE